MAKDLNFRTRPASAARRGAETPEWCEQSARQDISKEFLVEMKRDSRAPLLDFSGSTNVSGSEARDIVASLLMDLAPFPRKTHDSGCGLSSIKESLAWLAKAVSEGLLSEEEAQIVFNFIAGKYVERRLDAIIKNYFNADIEMCHSFRFYHEIEK